MPAIFPYQRRFFLFRIQAGFLTLPLSVHLPIGLASPTVAFSARSITGIYSSGYCSGFAPDSLSAIGC